MQLTKLDVDKTLKSTINYGTIDFPIVVYFDEFHKYDIGYIRWHWHKELEFVTVIEGCVLFSFLNEDIILSKGSGIFMNSNVLHQMKPLSINSIIITTVFDSGLIESTPISTIDKKYIHPILNNPNIKFKLLTKSSPPKIYEIYNLYKSKDFGYELLIKNTLLSLWFDLIINLNNDILPSIPNEDEIRIKHILKYIHSNYQDKISLKQISNSVHISKSECCRTFQKHLKISPFEYLLEYRITKASNLIKSTNKPFYEIAYSVGFNDTSYFSKIFKRFINMSPREYRKQNKKR